MSTTLLRRRGYVGLTLSTRPSLGGGAGLAVRAVARDSDAERAGVEAGDVLIGLDRNRTTDLAEVRHLLRGLRAGDPLFLEVLRRGERLTLETRVSEYPIERHVGAHTLLGAVQVGEHALRTISVVPDAEGPFPVVYYLPGAHWASEEYPLDLEHPVPALARALAAAGIAMVRVERSGVGDSQGPPCTRVDFEHELAGYRAGLAWLRGQDWAGGQHVFLFGHSLGAMVAPLLAAETPVAGVATFGASAIPISEGLVGALDRHTELVGDAMARARQPLLAELVRSVARGATPAQLFETRPDLARVAPAHFGPDEAYHRWVRFYHQLEDADVLGAWSKLTCPVIAMHGELDSITTLADSERIARTVGALASSVELGGVDHQGSVPGTPKPRLAPSLRTTLVDWLLAHR